VLARGYDAVATEHVRTSAKRTFVHVDARDPRGSAYVVDVGDEGRGRTVAFQKRGEAVVAAEFDDKESELATLDLLQMYLYALETILGGLDAKRVLRDTTVARDVLDEIIVGGIAVETDVSTVLQRVRENQSLQKSHGFVSHQNARMPQGPRATMGRM